MQSNWPNQEVWKRSLLETSPSAWQKKIGISLNAELKPELLEYFQVQTNIPIREALAWPLARFGGAEVFKALTLALTNDYRNATLHDENAIDLAHILRAMHPMTQNSPEASQFARQATEFGFWDKHRPFAGVVDAQGNPAGSVIEYFARAAISVLGQSMEPDIPELLESLRKRDINYTYYTAGALVSAAAEQDRKRRFPAEANVALDGESQMGWFKYWLEKTPNGKAWSEWGAGISKQRPTIQR